MPQDHFRTAGEVERADVMMDSSRRSKGWGTVRFRTPVSLDCSNKIVFEILAFSRFRAVCQTVYPWSWQLGNADGVFMAPVLEGGS